MYTEHSPQREPRKRIRRRGIANHFGIDIRTVDAWAKRGVIPAPHYLDGSVIPCWFGDETIDRRLAGQSKKSALKTKGLRRQAQPQGGSVLPPSYTRPPFRRQVSPRPPKKKAVEFWTRIQDAINDERRSLE